MGANLPVVELDKLSGLAKCLALSRMPGFLWHSSKWTRLFDRVLQYTLEIVLAYINDIHLTVTNVYSN